MCESVGISLHSHTLTALLITLTDGLNLQTPGQQVPNPAFCSTRLLLFIQIAALNSGGINLDESVV